jgi:hypothetical protein
MARIRHVVPHIEVAQLWLSQSQDTARSKGRGQMYFEGDTIYSYGSHFPIAKLFDAPNGEQVILFTTREYSMTTGSHIRVVQSVCNHSHRRIIYCHRPDMFLLPGDHYINCRNFKLAMDESLTKHAKARKPELYTENILYQAALAREYCEVMCFPIPTWAQMPGMEFVVMDKLFRGEPMRALLKIHNPEEVTT